jgi:hypothetical protein
MRTLNVCALSLALALLPAMSSLGAQEQPAPARSASLYQMEGQVLQLLPRNMFWLDRSGTKVLVYATRESMKSLRSGQRVRIVGERNSDYLSATRSAFIARTIVTI